ncbi:MAG: serine/threonine-protein kinase [Planctomycetota bacterium]
MVRDLAPNVELIPGYRLVRYLGRGGFGEVWEATAPGGLSKAIKIATIEAGTLPENCREFQGLQQIRAIRHPFLLSIERYEIVDHYLVIVMELADKSLADRYDECAANGLSGIPRDELLGYMRESAEALDVLNHRFGLQHLDVKPENLFLSAGHVKVADFGLVQPRNTNLTNSTIAISPPYAPPELFDGRVEPTADQYGLAVTYQELLTGKRPYSATDVRGLIFQHLRGTPDFSAVPPADRPILSRAISRDVEVRFDRCMDLIEALSNAIVFGTPAVTSTPTGKPLTRPLTERVRTPVKTDPAGVRRFHIPSTGSGQPTPEPRAGRDSRGTSSTVTVQSEGTVTSRGSEPTNSDEETIDHIRDTFVAFLPLEIFARKLRGFIDTMDAEVVYCDNDKTVLRLSRRGLLGFRSRRSIFIQLDTFTRNPHSGYRVIDATVWSPSHWLIGRQLVRRAKLLLRYLKSFLMAEDAIRGSWTSSRIMDDIFE